MPKRPAKPSPAPGSRSLPSSPKRPSLGARSAGRCGPRSAGHCHRGSSRALSRAALHAPPSESPAPPRPAPPSPAPRGASSNGPLGRRAAAAQQHERVTLALLSPPAPGLLSPVPPWSATPRAALPRHLLRSPAARRVGRHSVPRGHNRWTKLGAGAVATDRTAQVAQRRMRGASRRPRRAPPDAGQQTL